MQMNHAFSAPSDLLAAHDDIAARLERGESVLTVEVAACAAALAAALRATLATAPAPRRAPKSKALAFEMTAESFGRALKLAMRACAGRSIVPIFAGVRLDAAGDALLVTCNDVDREISVEVVAPGVGVWSAVVEARPLASLLSKVKGAITLQGDDGALIIGGAVTARMTGLDVEAWPRAPEQRNPYTLLIQPGELRDLLAYVQPAMSEEETRYYLNGAFLHVAGGQLAAVATDGHRLHVAKMAAWHGLDFKGQIIPRAAVDDILAMLAQPSEGFAFAISETGVTLKAGPVSLASKVIDGSFPDYVRVIPSRPPHVVEMAAADLDAALSKAAALKDRRAGASAFAQLIFAPGGVEVTARNADGVTLSEHVKADDCRCSFEFGFNVANLREAIKSAGAERVAFHISGENDAVIIADAAGDGSRVAVVMPMRR